MTQDMTNKVVLITGGGRGMGHETALMLGRMGAHVVIADWEGEAGTRTRDQINAAGPGSAEFHYCDLSSIGEVREFADWFLANHDRLDVLINNAGITDPVRRVSVDGNEMHVATCHLAHFLLTHLLLELLKKSAPARIIMISSEAHKAGPGLDFDDLNNERNWKNHGKASNNAAFKAYHRAKLSKLYFMYELAEKLQGTGVTINAISPGYFINTSIYRNMKGVFLFSAKIIFGFGNILGLNNPKRSAKTYVMLATEPALEQVTATYFQHGKIKETSDLAKEVEPRKKLWSWSVVQTGVGAD